MFTSTLERGKKEDFRSLPRTTEDFQSRPEDFRSFPKTIAGLQSWSADFWQSSANFPMLDHRIRKLSKVHQSILKRNPFLIVLSILLIKYHTTFSYNSCWAQSFEVARFSSKLSNVEERVGKTSFSSKNTNNINNQTPSKLLSSSKRTASISIHKINH